MWQKKRVGKSINSTWHRICTTFGQCHLELCHEVCWCSCNKSWCRLHIAATCLCVCDPIPRQELNVGISDMTPQPRTSEISLGFRYPLTMFVLAKRWCLWWKEGSTPLATLVKQKLQIMNVKCIGAVCLWLCHVSLFSTVRAPPSRPQSVTVSPTHSFPQAAWPR